MSRLDPDVAAELVMAAGAVVAQHTHGGQRPGPAILRLQRALKEAEQNDTDNRARLRAAAGRYGT